MKLSQLKSITLTAVATASLIAGAGCASKSYDKGSSASVAVQSSASQVAVLSTKVTDTLGALNGLAFKPEGDLRSQFDKFNSAVKSLQTAASDLDAKVTAMQGQGQAYLDNWNNQLAAIGSEDIRNLSAERKATVTTNLTAAVDSYEITKGALQPFLLDLRDIQTYPEQRSDRVRGDRHQGHRGQDEDRCRAAAGFDQKIAVGFQRVGEVAFARDARRQIACGLRAGRKTIIRRTT